MTATEESTHREHERLRLLVLAAQRDGARRLADSLRPAELTPSQAEMLGVLADSGPMSLTELGRRIVCENGSPSRTIDLLTRRGLVNRLQSPHDRRFVELEITEAGRTLLPTVVEGVRALDERISSALPAEERTELCRLLSRLLEGTPDLTAIELRCGPMAD